MIGWEGVEAMWRRKNGQPLAVRLTGRILASHEGDIFEVIVEDVTQRQQRESAARDADRLRAIGQLAARIAHEFNNLSAKGPELDAAVNGKISAAQQTVLIVDDVEGIRRLIARTLEQHHGRRTLTKEPA